MRERCPVCKMLKIKSAVKRLQPLPDDGRWQHTLPICASCGSPFGPTRYRYACSKGHEFDGKEFHDFFNPDGRCEDCYTAEEADKERRLQVERDEYEQKRPRT